MVLNYARQFLSIVSKAAPVIIIGGQHDFDVKSKMLSGLHSIISLFEDDKVTYIHDGKFNVGKYTGYAHGWDISGVVIGTEPADIYIGHGIVTGSSTPDGFIFNDGIHPNTLLEKYRLSIIGDIHNGVNFTDHKGRYVLVPGNLVQNSFRDAYNCGYWLIGIDDDNIELKLKRLAGKPFQVSYQ
jgi:hypothetical protein